MTGTQKQLRFGIVGGGYIANVHSAALRTVAGTFADAHTSVRLEAVADVDLIRAEALQDAWEWSTASSDWRAVTRSEDVDVVSICVPNAFHAEIAIDALEHGKHVICEKPLAHDLDSARAMAAAANVAESLSQVCFYYRLWPPIAWARTLTEQGTIGEPLYLRAWMLQDYASGGHDLGWRASRATAGAGALGDLGSHVFDIARHLCGEITEVTAITRSFVSRERSDAPIDDAITALVTFSSGIGGVLEASWAMPGHKCDLGFDLVGSQGALRFSWERCNEIEILEGAPDDPANGFRRVLVGGAQPDVARFIAVPGQGLGYRDAFTIGLGHFVEAVANDAPHVTPSFEDGLRAAEVVSAALNSTEERAAVHISGGKDR